MAQTWKKERSDALVYHWFPSILGPEGRYYIVDHHHFGLALLEEDVRTVSLMVLKDMLRLTLLNFWVVMDHYQWAHPYDSTGVRREFIAVPKHHENLKK